jgi:tetratricopeptide (TPR) repeat protein
MIDYNNEIMSNVGELIKFTNVKNFPLFEGFDVDYYLSKESITAINKHKIENEEIIDNDILGWALSKQISIGETKGAKGKRYLFWNINAKNISETILELIALQNFSLVDQNKILSKSAKSKESGNSNIVVSSTKINNSDRQRFVMDEELIGNLKLFIEKNNKLKLPFLIYRDFLANKLPQAKSRGGRFAFSDLEKIGIIAWGKIDNISRWYLTDFGHALLEAVQSWMISYILSQGISISMNKFAIFKELTYLQKFDVLVVGNQRVIPNSDLFKVFGTNQAIQHICISTYCLNSGKTVNFEEDQLVFQDGIQDDNPIKNIESLSDLWNSLNQSVMIPIEKPAPIKRIVDQCLDHLNTKDAMILIPGKIGYGKTTVLGQVLAKVISATTIKFYVGGQNIPLKSQILDPCIIAFDNINQLPEGYIRNLTSWFSVKNNGIILATIEMEYLDQFKQTLKKIGFPSQKLILATELMWEANEIEVIANSISLSLNKKLDPNLMFHNYNSPFEFLVEYLPEIRILVRERFLSFLGNLFIDYGDWISEYHKKVFHFIILLSRVEKITISYVEILLKKLDLTDLFTRIKGELSFLSKIIKKETINNLEYLSLPKYYHNMIPSLETHAPIDSKNLNFAKLVLPFFNSRIDAIHVEIYLEYSSDKTFSELLIPFLNTLGDFGLAHISKFMPKYVDDKYNILSDIENFNHEDSSMLSNQLIALISSRPSDIIILWFVLQLSLYFENENITRILAKFMDSWLNTNFNYDEIVFINTLEKNKNLIRFDKNDQKQLLNFIRTSTTRGYYKVSTYLIENFNKYIQGKITKITANNLNLLKINLKINTKEYKSARKLIDKEKTNTTSNNYKEELDKLSSKLDHILGKTKSDISVNEKTQSIENNETEKSKTYTDFVKQSVFLTFDTEELLDDEKWDKLKSYLQTFHMNYQQFMEYEIPHSKMVKIEYLRKMSVVKRVMLEIDDAKELLDQALKLALELDDPELISKIYGQLSQISEFKADYDDTINYLKESYKYNLQIGSHYLTIESLNKIGYMYGLVSEFSNAINWLTKAYELVKDCDEEHCKYQLKFTILNLARAYWFNGDRGKSEELVQSEQDKLANFPKDFHKIEFRNTESKQEIQAKKYFLTNLKQSDKLDRLIKKILKQLKKNKFANIKKPLIEALDELKFVSSFTLPIYLYPFTGIFELVGRISDLEKELIDFEEILTQKIAFSDLINQLHLFSYQVAFLFFRINKIDLARKWLIFFWLSSIVSDTNLLEYGIDANRPFDRYLESEDKNEKTKKIEVLIILLTLVNNLAPQIDVSEYNVRLIINSPNIFIEFVNQKQTQHKFREYKTISMIVFAYLAYILKHKKSYWPLYKESIRFWPENRLVEPNGVIFATLGRYWDINQEWVLMKYAYEKAVSLNRNPDPYWFHLGYAYLRLGEYDAALNAYNQVSSIDPDDWGAKSNILEILLLKKDYKRALELIQNFKLQLSRTADSDVSFIYFYEGLLFEILNSDNATAIELYKKSIDKVEYNLPAIYRKYKLENEKKSFSENQNKRFLLQLKGIIEKNALDYSLDSSELAGTSQEGIENFEGVLSMYYQAITKRTINEIPESYIQYLHKKLYGYILFYMKNINLFNDYLLKSFNLIEFIYNKGKMEEANNLVYEDDQSSELSFLTTIYEEWISRLSDGRTLSDEGKFEFEKLKIQILILTLQQIQPIGRKINYDEFIKTIRFIPKELLYEHYRYMELLDYSEIRMQQEFVIDFYKSKGPLLRDLKKLEEAKEVYEHLIKYSPAIHDGWIGMRDYYLLTDDIDNSLKYSTNLLSQFPMVQEYKLDHALLELYKDPRKCNEIMGSLDEIDEDTLMPIVEILKAYCTFNDDKDQAEIHFKNALDLLLILANENSLSIKDRNTIHKNIKQYGQLSSMGDLVARYLNHFIGKIPINIYIQLIWKLIDIIDNNFDVDNIPETWMETMKKVIFSLEPINRPFFYLPALKMAVVYLELGEIELFEENLKYSTSKWEPYLFDVNDINQIKQFIKLFPNQDIRNRYAKILLLITKNQDIQKQVNELVDELLENLLVIYLENNLLESNITNDIKLVLEKLDTELLFHLLASSNQFNLRKTAVYISMVILKRLIELLQN